MVKNTQIVDVNGKPIRVNQKTITQSQTEESASIGQLRQQFSSHPIRGLTPSKLAAILIEAEQGDITAQAELFEDIEERDAHIAAELGKRRRAVSSLPWNLFAPPSATAQEEKATDLLTELVNEIPQLDTLLYDLTDAIGKGFACVEMVWGKPDGKHWLPTKIELRPQTWFQLHHATFEQEIRLKDRNHKDGQQLRPMMWVTHKHKAKSGTLERSALFRVLVWPHMFKNYAIGDWAEWLEIYGVPLRMGTYHSTATDKEKRQLMRAVTNIGHNAAGIKSEGMGIDFYDAATGDPKAFEHMVYWAEKAQSKAILGGTLTSQADNAGSTHALAKVHDDVRIDIRDSDARQLAQTLTEQLIRPIAILNGLTSDASRAPRWRFDVSETEDITVFAEALPSLVSLGMKIPRSWAHEKLGIPQPDEDTDLLTMPASPFAPMPPAEDKQALSGSTHALAALRAEHKHEEHPEDVRVEQINKEVSNQAAPILDDWLNVIYQAIESSSNYDEAVEKIALALPQLDSSRLEDIIAQAMMTSELGARSDVLDEVAPELERINGRT